MNERHLLSLFALGLLLAAFLSFGTARSASPAAEVIQRTGVVVGWQLDMDGTIYIELSHPAEGRRARDASTGPTTTWFRTPPVRSEERHVQQMVLSILTALEMSPSFEAITIHGKVERALDGESLEEALPLVSLGTQRN